MKLWMSGEVQADVADASRLARKILEPEANRLLEATSIAEKIEKWAFIAMLRKHEPPDHDEVAKRANDGKNFEFRLKIATAFFSRPVREHRST